MDSWHQHKILPLRNCMKDFRCNCCSACITATNDYANVFYNNNKNSSFNKDRYSNFFFCMSVNLLHHVTPTYKWSGYSGFSWCENRWATTGLFYWNFITLLRQRFPFLEFHKKEHQIQHCGKPSGNKLNRAYLYFCSSEKSTPAFCNIW